MNDSADNADPLSPADVFYLQGISKILQVLQHHQDLDALIQGVAKATFDIFQCDRSFLLYPVDPDAPTFRVPVEVTRPEYPGALELNIDVPMTRDHSTIMQRLLDTRGPVIIESDMMQNIMTDTPQFQEKGFVMPYTQLIITIFPRIGKPWCFGMHQCSYPRQWSDVEQRLLVEIAARVAEALSSRLLLDDLRKSEFKYRRLVESLEKNYFLFSLDLDGRFSYVSPSVEGVLGYGPERFIAGYEGFLTDSPVNAVFRDQSRNSFHGQPQPGYELEIRADSGESRLFEVSETASFDAEGRPIAVEGIAHDITVQRRAQNEMLLSASVFEHAVEAIMVADAGRRILRVNRAFCDITGYGKEEVLGLTPSFLQSDRHDEAFYRQFWEHLERDGVWRGEVWDRRKDGSVFPARQTVSVVKESSADEYYISVFSDITEEVDSAAYIDRLTHYDALTNLPNRSLFYELCEHAIARSKRQNSRGAVIVMDLDRFKNINDSLGPGLGDRLLKAVSVALHECLRGDDIVARLGGDEFIILLEDFGDPGRLSQVAARILAAFGKPFDVDGYSLRITTSMGISIFPDDATDVDKLVQYADVSMYRTKEGGGNGYGFYTPELTQEVLGRVEMETELIQALERQEFVLHYQPQIDLRSGRLAGIEALIRWIHPEKGMISPVDFIPLAEDTGIIVPIGEWLIREVCEQIVRWDESGIAIARVAVNVSAQQFYQENFVSFLERCLKDNGLTASRLEVEITETFLMQKTRRALEVIHGLRDLGIELAIDDFGTGYSSLAYLKQLPISTLKIDRSFVSGIPEDANDIAITKAILAMADSLQLKIVAEGVETGKQRDFLIDHGGVIAQGFFYSKPLPASELVEYARSVSDCSR